MDLMSGLERRTVKANGIWGEFGVQRSARGAGPATPEVILCFQIFRLP